LPNEKEVKALRLSGSINVDSEEQPLQEKDIRLSSVCGSINVAFGCISPQENDVSLGVWVSFNTPFGNIEPQENNVRLLNVLDIVTRACILPK